jgi:hypothetical protein
MRHQNVKPYGILFLVSLRCHCSFNHANTILILDTNLVDEQRNKTISGKEKCDVRHGVATTEHTGRVGRNLAWQATNLYERLFRTLR